MATATDPKLTRHPSVLDAVRSLAPKITARAARDRGGAAACRAIWFGT